MLAGDFSVGNIYEVDSYTFDEDGETIVRYQTSGVLSSDDNRQSFNEIVIDVEHGQGLTNGQGEDPQMMLSWSDDGGYTWSNELWKSMGRQGEYHNKVRWDQLGQFDGKRIYRWYVSDPVPVAVTGVYGRVK